MLTARASHSQMGKPLESSLQVPRYARQTYNHKIAFTHPSNRTVEQYNSIVETYQKPCFRRYLEFRGFSYKLTSAYQYITPYHPPPILSNPDRFWTLVIDGQPSCIFTNVVEAWLIILSLAKFGSVYDTHLIYTDLTA